MTIELTPNSRPGKPRRLWRWLLAVLLVIITIISIALSQADRIITLVAQPFLASAGLPAGRVTLTGLGFSGTTVSIYPTFEATDALLSVILPFKDLRRRTLIVPKVEIHTAGLPKSEASAPLDWQAPLRQPLRLSWWPTRQLQITEWQLVTPALTLTGDAELNLQDNGAYDLKLTAAIPALDQPGLTIGPSTLKVAATLGQAKPVVKAELKAGGGNVTAGLASYPLGAIAITASYPAPKGLPVELSGQATLAGNPFNVKGQIEPVTQAINLRLTAKNASLDYATYKAAGLNVDARITGMSPITIADGARVTADRIEAGLPLLDATLTFGLKGARLDVATASTHLFDGALTLGPTSINLPVTKASGTITAEGLDLAAVLTLAKVEGLNGTGRLSGAIPVTLDGAALTIDNAELSTADPGTVKYSPATPPSFMAEGGSGAMIGQVFSDFHYKVLKLKLNGTLGRDLTMTTRIEGANPNFYSGYPVAFNLNLSGALDSVLRQGLASANLTAGNLADMMKLEGPPP